MKCLISFNPHCASRHQEMCYCNTATLHVFDLPVESRKFCSYMNEVVLESNPSGAVVRYVQRLLGGTKRGQLGFIILLWIMLLFRVTSARTRVLVMLPHVKSSRITFPVRYFTTKLTNTMLLLFGVPVAPYFERKKVFSVLTLRPTSS